MTAISPISARLGSALAVSAALHVAGFAWLAQGGASRPATAGAAGAPGVTVRLIATAETIAPAVPASPVPTTPAAVPTLPPASPAPNEGQAEPARGASVAATGDNLNVFLPPSMVDSKAYPLNDPDLSILDRVAAYSGDPVRLRVFVDAHGHVAKSEILHASAIDQPAAALIASTLERTDFMPARRGTSEVSSYLDVEIELTDVRGRPVSK